MMWVIFALLCFWGFSSEAPTWAKYFSWFFVLPIFILTALEMMMEQ